MHHSVGPFSDLVQQTILLVKQTYGAALFLFVLVGVFASEFHGLFDTGQMQALPPHPVFLLLGLYDVGVLPDDFEALELAAYLSHFIGSSLLYPFHL